MIDGGGPLTNPGSESSTNTKSYQARAFPCMSDLLKEARGPRAHPAVEAVGEGVRNTSWLSDHLLLGQAWMGKDIP